MKVRYLKLKNWIILSLMGALGITACHSTKEVANDNDEPKSQVSPRDEVILMYGVPAVNYRDSKVVPQPKEGTEAVDSKEEPRPREEQPVMYGVPTLNFRVSGKVVDANGNPVKGVQVVLMNSNIDTEHLDQANPEYMDQYIKDCGDTTAVDGTFECGTTDRPWDKQKLLVRDIDGDRNGSFADEMIEVEFPKPEGKGRGWNMGTVKSEVQVRLKDKE